MSAQNTRSGQSPPRQRIQISLFALIALMLFGLGASIYLTNHFYEVHSGSAGFHSLCNIGSKMNCDAVAASPYAELFLGIPLSSFSAGWYLGLLLICFFAMGRTWTREATRMIVGMTTVGVLFSIGYFYIMFGMLKTFCLFCLGIDGVNILGFGVALGLRSAVNSSGLATSDAEGRSQLKNMLATLGVCLVVAIVALKGLDQTDYKSSDIQELTQQILSQPVLPVQSEGNYPTLGPKNAPVTIVEFSDFECPFCRLGAMMMNTLLNRYPTQIKVVFRNYPLDMSCNPHVPQPMHEISCEAARVGYCANQQGKFKDVYETMFEDQAHLKPGVPEEVASQNGVDQQKLDACLKAPETAAAVLADIEEGTRLGINSTPTFFVNGRKVMGVVPIPVWDRVINEVGSNK